ncbi:MAG: response regulator [Deltaproteobacteria bacterium]|nr:response regulator [Deltaproteobacteria bacterium]
MRWCLTAPVATTVLVGESLEVHANDAFAPFIGPARHAAALGRPAREAFADLWPVLEPLVVSAPCVANAVRLVFDRAVASEEIYATLIVMKLDGGIAINWLETTQDVVERRRLETLRALAATSVVGRTVEETRDAVLRVVRANAGIGSASFAPDGTLVVEPSPHRPSDEAYRAFLRDVARIGEDLVARAAHATAHARAEDDFLSMLAHELRNPLAPVLTTLDVMRVRGQTDELAALERPMRHLNQLLDDLLEYSRIARGAVTLRRERVELADVVQRALEMSGGFADRVYVAGPRVGVQVVADVDRLANAISHLIVNAAQHGTPDSRVSIDATRTVGRVQLSVRNEGKIPDEVAARLFEAFVQEPQGLDRPRGGLGLGLAITRSLVEMHGGTIRASTSTAATEIVIDLPSEQTAVLPQPKAAHTRTRKRVLIVEDNDDTARALKTALETLGYEVAIAHDGPVALTVARTFRPEVALLDIGLPVMDGYELANRLRAMNISAKQLHVVAVTAYGAESYRQKSADAGFADHLVKPVDLAKLERVVEDLS